MSVRTTLLTLSATALAVAGTVVTIPGGAAATADPARPAPGAAAEQAAITETWGPVKRLSQNPQGQALVVDAHDTTTVVWANSWRHPTRPRAIMALRRDADGTWGKARVIGRGYAPRVAADADGTVTAVWLTQRRNHTDGVATARRPVGGGWSDPVRLTRDLSVPGYPVGSPEVYGAAHVALAVSPRGATVVAWDWGSDARHKPWRVQSVFRPRGGAWSDLVNVTAPTGANSPQVGIGRAGTATLLYGRQPFGHPQALFVKRRLPDAGWTGPTRLAAEGYAPTLAVDVAGNAAVTYSPDFSRVVARYRAAAGRWSVARRLSPPGVEVNDVAVEMNGDGVLVAMVRGNGRVDLVRRPPGGPWSAAEPAVPADSAVFDVMLGLNAAGDTFLGWGGYAVHGRYRPAGGAWGDRSTISPETAVDVLEETYAEVAPGGDVVVLWKQEEKPLKVRVMTVS